MNKITTCLWFDDQAQEAAAYYASVFRRASVGKVVHAAGGGEPYVTEGAVLLVEFEIEGQHFVGLNGGKQEFSFNHAISFQVLCADQAEVDEYWDRLLADGGKAVECGWITDKYGLSWQIVPEVLMRLLSGPDRSRAARVNAAMLQMVKLDVEKLEQA